MNTALLDRLIERARDAAASPAEEMALRDLAIDLQTLADACEDHGLEPCDLAGLPDDLKGLREHASTRPFDVSGDTCRGAPLIIETGEGAFEDWLATLERLAQ
jgi:hypothetical protein